MVICSALQESSENLEELATKQAPFPLTCTTFAVPPSQLAVSLQWMAFSLRALRDLFAKSWGSCASYAVIPRFNDMSEG